MPQTLYENNRKVIARELLGDLSPWQELEEKIIAYAPAHVILVARRMPRIWQLLQTLDVFRLAGMNVVSNFAIPFMRKKLKAGKIAIVDDSLNVGTTFVGVCEALGQAAECQCFALSYNRNTAKKPVHENVEYAIKEGWSDWEYRQKLQKFTEALGLLSLPFELEFPVYKVASDIKTLRELPGRLLRLGAGCRP